MAKFPDIKPNCVNGTIVNSVPKNDFDAFLYIIAVLFFYAIAMILLMVKYLRREEHEADLEFYFEEYVKREKFTSLNRHKYQSDVFKQIMRGYSQLPPLSSVYNQAKHAARRSAPGQIARIYATDNPTPVTSQMYVATAAAAPSTSSTNNPEPEQLQVYVLETKL